MYKAILKSRTKLEDLTYKASSITTQLLHHDINRTLVKTSGNTLNKAMVLT